MLTGNQPWVVCDPGSSLAQAPLASEGCWFCALHIPGHYPQVPHNRLPSQDTGNVSRLPRVPWGQVNPTRGPLSGLIDRVHDPEQT